MSQAPAPDDDVKREYEVGRSMNFQMVIRGVGDVGLAPSELPSESGTLFFFFRPNFLRLLLLSKRN